MSRLPPPCLSVKLSIMENKPSSSELTPTRLGFPTEFPYEFDSPAYSPGFTSPGDSTETEDESSDDEEDFLAGLTRRLAPSTHRRHPLPANSDNTKAQEKRQLAATSPQSTLSGLGSFSNSGSRSPILPYPPTMTAAALRRDSAWDTISAAAGEVAKLKMGSYESHLPRQNHEFLLRRQNAAFQADNSLQQQQQRFLDEMWLCSQSRVKPSENHFTKRVVNQEVAFENLRLMRLNAISNSTWFAGTPLKRPSAGTGVFLPRRYPTTNPSESFKKPGTNSQSQSLYLHASTRTVNTKAMLPSRVNPQNLSFDEFTTTCVPRRSQFDYECGRGLSVGRQGSVRSVGGGGGCLNHERRLPQDWMY